LRVKLETRVPYLEFLVKHLLGTVLADKLAATRSHVTKKQTRTIEELREDQLRLEEEEEGFNFEVVEEQDAIAKIANPLNLPLGWDGKPIPYWLYRLHGLGVEYKCEICGNFSYWGRRNFDLHFTGARHTKGMKTLGIPNTRHFHDVTKIDDALALYSRLKAEFEEKKGYQEECEDKQGNVMSKKVYLELKKQGLL